MLRDIPDFPTPGVVFKDITPLIGDAGAFASCVEALAASFAGHGVDKVVGIEARGFIVAAPVAVRLGAGFVPVRKPGKLPGQVRSASYDLEYGTDGLELHHDALLPRQRVLMIDDVLATGGTAAAAGRLVEGSGATAVGFGCIIELEFLGGRGKLNGLETVSLVNYER
ncbi:MAG: adenine phosphoribosyltransferase [Acidimicrobiales bacterium]